MKYQIKTRAIFSLSILFVLLNACKDAPPLNINTAIANKYQGVIINNYLPTGTIYIDSTGEKQGYRSILFDITNDTTIPLNLQIELPSNYINLFPISDSKYAVFILPELITKEQQFTSNDSLTKELQSFISKRNNNTETLTKIIKPGDTYQLRLGFIFSPDGLTRAELFSKGHPLKLCVPKKTIKFKKQSIKNGFELMLGVTLYDDYSSISCGQITF